MKLSKQRLVQIIKEELSESDWYSEEDETLGDYKFRMNQEMDDPDYLASLEDMDPDALSDEDILDVTSSKYDDLSTSSRESATIAQSKQFRRYLRERGVDVSSPEAIEDYLRKSEMNDQLARFLAFYAFDN